MLLTSCASSNYQPAPMAVLSLSPLQGASCKVMITATSTRMLPRRCSGHQFQVEAALEDQQAVFGTRL